MALTTTGGGFGAWHGRSVDGHACAGGGIGFLGLIHR